MRHGKNKRTVGSRDKRRVVKKKKNRNKRSKGEKEISEILKKVFLYKIINEYKIDKLPYDIFVKDLNLIIEYYGDRWHQNPQLYDENHYDKLTGLYAKEKWARDKKKRMIAESLNYNIIVIWQKDWMKSSDKRDFIKNLLRPYRT